MRTRRFMACGFTLSGLCFAACSSEPPAAERALPPVTNEDGGAGRSEPDGAPGVDAEVEGGPSSKVPCPAGMPARWTCDAAAKHRVRCTEGFVDSITCASGCVAGSAPEEATCSCGANIKFSRWNCGADGDLHACAGGGAWLEQSCSGRGCISSPAGTSDTCALPAGSRLQALLQDLGTRCAVASPGATCAVAVRDLTTGEHAHYRGTSPYVSASSAKAIWVAAALHDTAVLKVEPYADPIFSISDNSASGHVIDLLVSPDRVNTFMWQSIGIPDSAFCSWNFDKQREAANCPRLTYGLKNNYFTANDMVAFMTSLWDKSLLGAPRSKALLDWMLLSPRSGYGGWMGTMLPAAARITMHHKSGWLPPDVVPGMAIANEIGIVEIPGGHAYAAAILTEGNRSAGAVGIYNGMQLPLVEKASCAIYHAVANDVASPLSACGL